MWQNMTFLDDTLEFMFCLGFGQLIIEKFLCIDIWFIGINVNLYECLLSSLSGVDEEF